MNSEENFITEIKETFFFDSYAFFSILHGNVNYDSYMDCNIVTSKLNLFEVYSGLLKEVNEERANELLNRYYSYSRDFDVEVIKSAAKLKLQINNRNVSMTDCIGYMMAKELGIKFLTGDKEFANMDNVEFVK